MAIAPLSAVIAANIANGNAAKSRETKEFECKLFVKGFEHDSASVKEIQTYSECASLLYPDVMTERETYAAKCIVAVLIAAMVTGFLYGGCRRSWGDSLFFAMAFPLGLVLAAIVSASVVYGVVFILS